MPRATGFRDPDVGSRVSGPAFMQASGPGFKPWIKIQFRTALTPEGHMTWWGGSPVRVRIWSRSASASSVIPAFASACANAYLGCRGEYRGTSLIRNTPLLGPYSRAIPRVLWWS